MPFIASQRQPVGQPGEGSGVIPAAGDGEHGCRPGTQRGALKRGGAEFGDVRSRPTSSDWSEGDGDT